MVSPVERIAGLTIGTVESVSPAQITAKLEIDAPQATALNTGVPQGFPRVNGYVLIPNEAGSIVGLVVWLGIEESPYPKRPGMRDFGLIDLPFPLRKLSISPIGTLITNRSLDGDPAGYRFERGISAFPSIGDPVRLATVDQLKSLVESQAEDQRVQIGKAPLAADAAVSVNPDKVFGRHLAVLGNTGSGKSCSVAGLIRWSLDSAAQERTKLNNEGPVNARFIVLDPNGEYLNAFMDLDADPRIFRVPPVEAPHRELSVPAWMWDSREWTAFAAASPGTQRPLLLQALRDLRAGMTIQEPAERNATRLVRSYKSRIEGMIAGGTGQYQGFPGSLNCGKLLGNIHIDLTEYSGKLANSFSSRLLETATTAGNLEQVHKWESSRSTGYNDFSQTDLNNMINALEACLAEAPITQSESGPDEDAPSPFDVNELADYLDHLASDSPSGQLVTFISTLTMRIRMMLADQRLGPVVASKENDISFDQWLEDYIGADGAVNGQVAVLDLSLVPSDVLHIVIAVVARVTFEALQRYRRLNGQELPTVMVLEEAHNFVRSFSRDEVGGLQTPSTMCLNTFERIAREGRKFGLGLVLSSQRPSEISPTVLAQCNTFLLHRIVNDQDQRLLARLVPDNLSGLLEELPSLPTQQAVLLGWAAPIPALVKISDLPRAYRPQSDDPGYWEVWTGESDRSINWKEVADEWIS